VRPVPEDLFRPQLGEPHHHAYVVEHIEATVNRLVGQLGAGPFFRLYDRKGLDRMDPELVEYANRAADDYPPATTPAR
jgi:hypothetical protein